MAQKPAQAPAQGEIVAIPARARNVGRVAMRSDPGRTLWTRWGSLGTFALAAVLPILPMVLLALLMRQSDSSLLWLWIGMVVITESIALLVAYGIVRTLLEAEA